MKLGLFSSLFVAAVVGYNVVDVKFTLEIEKDDQQEPKELLQEPKAEEEWRTREDRNKTETRLWNLYLLNK